MDTSEPWCSFFRGQSFIIVQNFRFLLLGDGIERPVGNCVNRYTVHASYDSKTLLWEGLGMVSRLFDLPGGRLFKQA